MSPVVLRSGKYTVVIYTHVHTPPHVHVKRADKEARVSLNPVEIMDNWGFKPSEIRAILKIVANAQQQLLDRWNEIHGE
jgi:hypothetical protein